MGGQYHLLVVDGHNSHYSLEFITFACQHKIVVACYPAHATHVLQGLDVIFFSLLKQGFTKHHDEFNLHNYPRKLNKTSFLSVFGLAWMEAVAPAHIITSFCVTGVYPVNPSVISPTQLTPSIEHLTHSNLPLPVTSPVKQTMHFHSQLMACKYH